MSIQNEIQNELLNERQSNNKINLESLGELLNNEEVLDVIAKAVEEKRVSGKKLKRPDYDEFTVAIYQKPCSHCKNGLTDGSICEHCDGSGKNGKKFPVMKIGNVITVGDETGELQFVDIHILRTDLDKLENGLFIEEKIRIPYVASPGKSKWCNLDLVKVKSIDIKEKIYSEQQIIDGEKIEVKSTDQQGNFLGMVPLILGYKEKKYVFEYENETYTINSKYVNLN